jgi:hypothetical protein
MQKYLFINTKGFTIDQAIIAMHDQVLTIMEKDPGLKFFSVNFINAMEEPKESKLTIAGKPPGQQVMVVNCCVVLVGEMEEEIADQPTAEEAAQLKRGAQFLCSHSKLKVTRYTKEGHKGYYQVCENCGAEVWPEVQFK